MGETTDLGLVEGFLYFYSFACDKDKSDGSFYCLQPIVVKKCDEATKTTNDLQSELDDNEWYEVIDGQQRLTTLFLMYKKLHQLLYKTTDLVDWMQQYGAIRYKDNYISRPGSSYDWIYVYGYSNEIITELIMRDWSCENRCAIGEEPNKKEIPYYCKKCVGDLFN